MEIGQGTRALVTGASRGIGRALAEALAARGATVGLAARSTDELDALAAALPGTHHVLTCDVTDPGSVASRVDGFIAAAGGHELSGTGVSLTLVYPGEIATALGDHDRDPLPDWHRGDTRSADAGELAERVIAGVEADERAVYFPAAVRALGVLHGVSPALSDR